MDTTEDRIALSTSELAQYYQKTKGKPTTTDNIKKTYLDELKNNGLIDDIESKIDKRRKIYFPIVDHFSFSEKRKLHEFMTKMIIIYNSLG